MPFAVSEFPEEPQFERSEADFQVRELRLRHTAITRRVSRNLRGFIAQRRIDYHVRHMSILYIPKSIVVV